mgnify:CR=1 FL=1
MKISCIRYTNRLLAMLSLTGSLAIVVCSCNTSTIEVQKPSTGNVTVDLALNVSPQHSTTRLSADITQQSAGSFRGLQDWTLIPFAATAPVNNSNTPLSGVITNPSFEKEGTTYNYLDRNFVDAVIGTSAYLCYGRAMRASGTDNFDNGYTVAAFGNYSPSQITFSPEQICSLETLGNEAKGTALLAYLNGIAQAAVEVSETTYTWSELSSQDSGLEKIFKTMTNYDEATAAYRFFAGSSTSIKAIATSAYNIVAGLSYTAGTWQAALQAEILSKITYGLTSGTDYTIDGTPAEITITSLGTDRDGFPANIKLPDGVAAVRWNDTDKAFEFATPTNVATDYKKLVYPAELWYHTNSPIKTSNTSQASYYNNTWDNVLGRYTDGTAVTLQTRSIAIVNSLQYGVGCIEGIVQATSSTLRDANNYAISLTRDEGGTTLDNFPLTAILVSGQYDQLFDFTPNWATTQPRILYDTRMGYDADTKTGTINLREGSLTMDNFATATGKFYTLSLQTPDATAGEDKTDVKIVLEFQNNSGESFYGENGLIAPDMRFYLVGTITAPTTGDLKRVVTQDHRTQLIINVESLRHAYNVIPDLNTALNELKVVDIGVKSWTDRGNADHPVYNW